MKWHNHDHDIYPFISSLLNKLFHCFCSLLFPKICSNQKIGTQCWSGQIGGSLLLQVSIEEKYLNGPNSIAYIKTMLVSISQKYIFHLSTTQTRLCRVPTVQIWRYAAQNLIDLQTWKMILHEVESHDDLDIGWSVFVPSNILCMHTMSFLTDSISMVPTCIALKNKTHPKKLEIPPIQVQSVARSVLFLTYYIYRCFNHFAGHILTISRIHFVERLDAWIYTVAQNLTIQN